MGVKSTPVRDENGVLHNVIVTCTEVSKDGSVCGGMFKRDGRGDYVCQNCGIIYEREDKFVAEDLTSDSEEFEFDDEDNLEEGTTQKDLEIGGVLPAAMSAVESRLSRNLAKFRASRSSAPKDEVEAKAKAHADKERHEKARKAFAKLGGHTVYENKIAKSKANHAKRQVLAFVKQGVNTTGQLMQVVNLASEGFYKLIADMEKDGRITTEKVGKARVVKVVATGKEYKGRCPALMVMPVLPQVRYGNIQGKTINYRNSQVIVAIYDASAPTLYTRKE
jgi:predicted transcriptional regulator